MSIIKDLCITIVFYNGDSTILKKVENYRLLSECIYIVDNNSNDESKSLLRHLELNNLAVIKYNESNMGISYALNQALEYSTLNKKKFLLTMDQDSEIAQDSVQSMYEAIKKDENLCSVGPYYGFTDDNYPSTDKYVTNLITSGNLVNVEKALAIGGYTEKLFIDCVDIDFSFKVICAGYKMKKIANAHMKHKIGEYERSRILGLRYLSHNPERFYYIYRNNIYIYKTYFWKIPKLCFKLFLSLCYSFVMILFVERNKVKKLRFAFKGIRDGMLNEF